MKKLLFILLLFWFSGSVVQAQSYCLRPAVKVTDLDGNRLDSLASPFRTFVKLTLNITSHLYYYRLLRNYDARIILGRGKSIVSETIMVDFGNHSSLGVFHSQVLAGDRISIGLIKPMAVSTTGKKRGIYTKPVVLRIK